MPKKAQRKLRGKIRQHVRWAIDDKNWEDDLLTADEISFNPEIKEKTNRDKRSRKKANLRQPTHRDQDLWLTSERYNVE